MKESKKRIRLPKKSDKNRKIEQCVNAIAVLEKSYSKDVVYRATRRYNDRAYKKRN